MVPEGVPWPGCDEMPSEAAGVQQSPLVRQLEFQQWLERLLLLLFCITKYYKSSTII